MADPLTIVGTAASIAGIVEALAKTVSTLHELHSRWKQADFIFINLIAQLTALKAALGKLEEWMASDLDKSQDPHHQLVMDLEVSVTCCWMLFHKMDSEVSELYRNADNTLDSQSKLKLLVKNGTLEGLQKMVEQQTGALTLLLTVCNCKAISDQKILLEKSSTRKTIQRMKDDTSSLYVQRDSTSINSRVSQFTDTLSKISRSFEFDRELFSTKVYGSAFRGSLKHTVEALRRQKAQMESIIRSDSLEKEEKRRNLLIDRQLEEDQNRLRTECKVLVLGDDDCGQDFLKQTKLYQIRGLSTGRRWEYLWEYKNVIRDNVREIMKALGSIIKEANSELDEKTMDLARRMDHELTVNPNDDPVVSAAAAEALRGLWASEQISELIQSARSRLPISAEYFIKEIDRTAHEYYVPTENDILMAEDRRAGIREYRITQGSLFVKLYKVPGHSFSNMKKWIHCFQNVTCVVYFVDLASYDQVYLINYKNKLLASLEFFRSLINSHWFTRSSVILFLSNVDNFRRKLKHDRLSNYFPDYTGLNDVNSTSTYVIEKFTSQNWKHLAIYPLVSEASDYVNIRLFLVHVRESIQQRHLMNTGII